MATREQLQKWERALRGEVTLFRGRRQRSAVQALVASRNDPQVVPLLVQALNVTLAELAQQADAALRDLSQQIAVDALCALWAQDRDEGLGALVAQCRYMASKPVDVRVRSGLKAGAVERLSTGDAATVRELVAARADRDGTVAANAQAVLGQLSNQDGVDALCTLWAQDRDEGLGALIAQCRYVASKPADLRLLTALKARRRAEQVNNEKVVTLLLPLLEDSDETVRAGAEEHLRRVQPGPAQDALCEAAIRNVRGPAAQICIETGKRPSDPERACLLLVVTGQLDAYFAEDFEFQNLRLAMERARETEQAQVMDVYRQGDVRWSGFIVAGGGGRGKPVGSKPLSACSEREIRLWIDSKLRHSDWQELFAGFLQLPAKYGFPLLDRFRQSGWQPEQAEMRSLYQQVLADSEGKLLPPPKEPSATSSCFEQWLARGREAELTKLSEQELLSRLGEAAPPDGVAIVAALAQQAKPGSEAAKTILASRHWLARLAGYASGLIYDLKTDAVSDPNLWITDLAGSAGVLEVWPSTATPADLEELSNAPAEAFAGKLGAVRKVLQTVMGHRITTGVVEEMVVEAGEFAVVVDDFEEVE